MYPAFLDESLKKLLHGCLCRNPQSRLSAKDCVYELAMAGIHHMNELDRAKIIDAFGCKSKKIHKCNCEMRELV